MKNFYEMCQILESQQKMLFSTKSRELYHGSNTGVDNSVVNSFKTKGISPNIAHGHGQGAGFYVWSDKKSAINHAFSIKKDSITTQAKQDGLPMVVTAEAILEPSHWDLDYEMNKKNIVKWLYSNFEELQKILNQNQSDARLYSKVDGWMSSDNETEGAIPGKGVQITVGSTRTTLYPNNHSSIRSAEMISQIVNGIQQKDPNIVYKFEELFFANLPKGTAIKYVGQEPLKPKNIEVFQDNQWVQV